DIPHFAVALDLTYLGVHDELDFRVGPRALLEDRLSAELTPAVDDVDLRGVARQEVALLQRRVASADNRQLLALEEGAITNGAVRAATPGDLCLSGRAQAPGQAAGRHDQGWRSQHLTAVQPDDLGPVGGHVDLLDALELADIEAELASVVEHLDGEVAAEDRLEAGIVLDHLGVEQLAAHRATLHQNAGELHSCGVRASPE